MFNIGGGEFLVIALIALIVLGPQRLPDAARQVGKTMGELRRLSSGFQNELKGALEDAERTPSTSPPRNVLGADTTAAPEPSAPSPSRTPAKAAPRPPRTAPLQAAPVSKAPRPRNKGS